MNAIENFIKVVGNKTITDLTQDDLIASKDWLWRRIHEEELGPNGAQ